MSLDTLTLLFFLLLYIRRRGRLAEGTDCLDTLTLLFFLLLYMRWRRRPTDGAGCLDTLTLQFPYVPWWLWRTEAGVMVRAFGWSPVGRRMVRSIRAMSPFCDGPLGEKAL